jgi:hypothetical protein
LVLSQNATATKEATVVADLFAGIADAEARLADPEWRAAEDLRDIVEGYDVVSSGAMRCTRTQWALTVAPAWS